MVSRSVSKLSQSECMNRRLFDAVGRLITTLTAEEARNLERQGKVRRRGKTSYTLIQAVPPSLSLETPCCLVRYDLLAVVGLVKLDEIEAERLIGWRLIQEHQPVSRSHREAAETRASYFPLPPDWETA